ncbi:MAG: thioredoxin family protein, partial [Bacteroidales bacterium]
MLDQELKIQVSALFEGLTSSYIFQISAAPTHPERDNLIHFLTEVAECSPNITVEAENKEGLEFTILKDGIAAPVRFQAIPTGHEFSTLLLLILNLDGKGKNFPDDRLQQRIRALDSDILLESFISLSCTNCPDVVQALNMISILNPKIQHRIIDGALQQEEADKRNIKAVPSVFSNGALLHVGRGSIGELIQKLEERFGSAPVETNTPPA